MLSEKKEWEISDWGIFKWNICNKSPVLHFKFSVFYFVHLKFQYKETEIHIFLRRLEEKFTEYICFMITKDQIGQGGNVGFITGNSRFFSSIFCSVSKSYEACKKNTYELQSRWLNCYHIMPQFSFIYIFFSIIILGLRKI